MKRIISLFLSLLMVVSLVPTAFAAEYNGTTISFSITSENENVIYVQPGTELTIDISTLNKTNEGEEFKVQTVWFEVPIDKDFFEVDEANLADTIESDVIKYADMVFLKKTSSYKAKYLGNYTELPGWYRMYADKEKVGSFKVKVKATSGQTTVLASYMSLYEEDPMQYTTVCDPLTVIIGDEPVTQYTVKYISEGEEVLTSQNAAGTISVAPAPGNGPAGYRFKGWKNGGSLYQPGDSYELTSDTTFTAEWEQVAQNYTLTFETNGGTAVDPVTAPEGTIVDLTSKTTNKTGYIFDGWYLNSGLTGEKVSSITLDGNKTIYAKWKEPAKPTYTLTFDTKGGSSYSPITNEEGTVIDLSAYKPTKSGYTFKGWYSDTDLKQKVTSVTLNADMTIYAKWEAKQSSGGGGGGGAGAEKYSLIFNTNGGSEIDTLEVKEGVRISLDKYVPQKTGYKFDGWHSDEELTKKITEIALSKDTTIYAKWIISDGGSTDPKPGYKPAILTDEHYAYIVGRDGGMIAPESDITRAEVATIIYRLLNEDERNKAKTKENVFTDVNEEDWFNTAVSTLASLELVNGRTTDTFAPNDFITRAELATIFARMVEVEYDGKALFGDVSGHWAESYIGEAATAEWIVGYNGLFRPDDNITRAEVMTLVNRVLNREPESKEDLLSGMTTWIDNADENAWYYLAVQEATNSHTFEMKSDGKHEKWTSLTENPDWSTLEG